MAFCRFIIQCFDIHVLDYSLPTLLARAKFYFTQLSLKKEALTLKPSYIIAITQASFQTILATVIGGLKS